MALTISYDLIYAPSEFRTNTQVNGNQISPDVIGLTNGGFVSAYNNIAFNGITLDFYDAAAAGVAVRFAYGSLNDLSAGQPALTQLTDENVLVVWDENLASDPGIRGRLFSPTGTTIGDVLPLVIAVSDVKDPQVAALVGGGFVVTLTVVVGAGDEDIYFASYNDAGVPQHNASKINTVTTGNQNDTAIAALADGGFVITYTDAADVRHRDIRAAIYDANGSVRKADFLISSDKFLLNDQFQSKVVGLPNGNFAVVYTDTRWADENGSDGITLKIYNPAGGNVTPGAFVHVNTPTPGFNESDPDVTVLPNGFMVVTWTYPSSPTDHDIYVRIFDQNGTGIPLFGFMSQYVITNSPTDDLLSAVSHLIGGKFITSWQDSQSDSSGGQITSTVSEITRTVTGDAANDTFAGDALRDVINGGGGLDTLAGGPQADKFIFDAAALADARLGTPVFDRIIDYDQGSAATYNATEGDQVDLSALLSTAFNNGSGQAVPSLVRAVVDATGAQLQIDTDGAANGQQWTTIAHLDGLRGGNTVNVMLDASQPAGAPIVVLSGPTITSNGGGDTATILLAENTSAVTTVMAPDPDAGAVVTFSIIGGNDQAKFQINAATGVLTFISAPNFEAPADSDHNNSYVIQVRASDGSLFDNQTITINVSNVNETPTITSNGGGDTATVSIVENTAAVTTVVAADLDAGTTLGFSIVGGVDAARFQINASTGALSFITAPDFDTSADADHNNSYIVQVRASDGSLSDTQTITVFVTDVDDANDGGFHGDFDGNGRSDILFRTDAGVVAVWQLNSAGQLAAAKALGSVSPDWHIEGFGDFDANGRSDILFRNDDGSVAIWTTDAAGNLASAKLIGSAATSWHVSGIGDFDGNGRSDILLRNDDGSIALWQTDSSGQLASAQLLGSAAPSFHIVGIGDFDGNGRSDILFRNVDGSIAAWQTNAAAQLTSAQLLGSAPTFFHVAALGDLDGNGRTDILFRSDNGAVALWQTNGSGQLSSAVSLGTTDPSFHMEGTGDFNGDGRSDILWRNDGGTTVVDWLMNGTSIQAPQVVGSASTDFHISIHHFDLV